MREFEEEATSLSNWKNLCLAKPIPGLEDDKVACEKKSFKSPLDLFDDRSKLEDMSQDEILDVLSKASSNFELWKQFKSLFDKEVSAENLTVKYMRSIMSLAGPIGDPNKRYESLDDDEEAQKDTYIEFSKNIDALGRSGDTKFKAIERIAWNT